VEEMVSILFIVKGTKEMKSITHHVCHMQICEQLFVVDASECRGKGSHIVEFMHYMHCDSFDSAIDLAEVRCKSGN
jgi:hypothetical protein